MLKWIDDHPPKAIVHLSSFCIDSRSLKTRTSLSVPPLPLGPLKYDSQHAQLCPNSQYFPLSWDTCTNQILPHPPLVLHQHPKCLWKSIKCSPLEPTIKVLQRTYINITHSAKSEKNPADLLHPSPIPIHSPLLAYQYHCLALLQWLLRCGLGFLARYGAICDVGIIVIPETSTKPFKTTTVPRSKQRTTASSNF